MAIMGHSSTPRVLCACEESQAVTECLRRMGIMSSLYRKPDQIVQPWMFGEPETKATCLWLKGLPKLRPTDDVHEAMEALPNAEKHRIHSMPPSPQRGMLRSKTYPGIADAMATQWGEYLIESEKEA